MTTLPAAIAHALHLRGFAWNDEVEPTSTPTADAIPVLDETSTPVGHLPPPATPLDAFSLLDQPPVIPNAERKLLFVRLEDAEIELLYNALALMRDAGVDWPDDDTPTSATDIGAAATSPAQAIAALGRRGRAELVRALGQWCLREQHIHAWMRRSEIAEGLAEIRAIRERLLTDSTRLAANVLGKLTSHRRDDHGFAALLLAACEGLEIAIDRFEHARGFQFSTYATQWIRSRVNRTHQDHGRGLRAPVHLHDSLRAYVRTQRQLWVELERRPTHDEVLAALGDHSAKAASAVRFGRPVLHALTQSDVAAGEDPVAEEILDPEIPTTWQGGPPAHWVPGFQGRLLGLCTNLVTRNAIAARIDDIVQARLAIGEPARARKTLRELGEHYGVSRERIRQQEEEGMAVLRRRLGLVEGELDDLRPWRLGKKP